MSVEELSTDNLDPNPIAEFERWLDIAKAANLRQPVGVTLSTADATGVPSARIVLLRGVDERGFTFFTNYESLKSREMDANPNAALTFYWAELDRQVRVAGSVERTSDAESDAYWKTRPRGSQLSAIVSHQSSLITSKQELIESANAIEKESKGAELPRPKNWGGWRLIPRMIEFWQEGPFRMHDRIRYRREDGNWVIERLAP